MQKTKSRYWFIIKNQTLCAKRFTENSLLLNVQLASYIMHVKFGDKNKTADFLRLQEKALRIINFKNFSENENPLFKENQILKISDLFHSLQKCIVYQEITLKGKFFHYLMTCLLY